MTLTFLGAGAAFSRRYGTTCSLLQLPDQTQWLIDCGRQAPEQLEASQLTWHELDGQIITHVHGDHVYGLEEFAFQRFFVNHPLRDGVLHGGARPKLIVHSAVHPELWEFLAPSLRYIGSYEQPVEGTLEHFFEPLSALRATPDRGHGWPDGEYFESGELQIWLRETPHVPGKPSCALELRAKSWGGDPDTGPVAWWSGDSRVEADRLHELLPRTTVFFHDCSFLPHGGFVHADYEELAQLPRAMRNKIVLMHHEDDLDANRARAQAAGFRVAMPGDIYDLRTGQKIGQRNMLAA